MAKPKEILDQKKYTNYRNVRAAAMLFFLLGSIFVLGGIAGLSIAPTDSEKGLHPAIAIGFVIVGLATVVGAIATLRGSRRWAKLTYVMAVPYLLVFPIGAIIGYILLSGMSRYLDSKERIKQATTGEAESDYRIAQ